MSIQRIAWGCNLRFRNAQAARMYRGRIALCLSALILLLTQLLLSVAEAGFSVGGPLS